MSLLPGDLAPNFKVASSVNPLFTFDTAAGRYIVLSFFASTGFPPAARLLDEVARRGTERFDVGNAIFFGVTTDADDVAKLTHADPGRVYFYDLDLEVSRIYGLVGDAVSTLAKPPTTTTNAAGRTASYAPKTFVLDRSLRIVAIISLGDDAAQHLDAVFSVLDSLPDLTAANSVAGAPVLIVPYVFEPALCRRLIEHYGSAGGEDSGFMRDVDGKTVHVTDYSHKRRMDCEINDQSLIDATQERIRRRVIPAIRQAYQFTVTRIERHIVACYDAAQGAHFRAHRDNTTLGTAHRRFAVTINLNSPEYEGGEIWFPEFGRKKYKAPSGAAIIFSCSLLHEVPRVTRGKRYAFLPFLYDDAAAVIRAENRKYLGEFSSPVAGSGKPAACGATHRSGDGMPLDAIVASSKASGPMKVLLDGSVGCGNPEGCHTCLTAASHPLTVNSATQTALAKPIMPAQLGS